MSSFRDSNNSASAYSNSGSGAGWSATSATIVATRPGSMVTLSRHAGWVIVASSSPAVMWRDRDLVERKQFTEAGMPQRPVVEVGAQRGDHAQSGVRGAYGRHQLVEEAVAHRGIADLCEQFFELVHQENEL